MIEMDELIRILLRVNKIPGTVYDAFGRQVMWFVSFCRALVRAFHLSEVVLYLVSFLGVCWRYQLQPSCVACSHDMCTVQNVVA